MAPSYISSMSSQNSDDNLDENISSLSLCSQTLLDLEEFRRQGYMMIDFLVDYYRQIENHPVKSQVEPGYLSKILPESAPYNAEPIETILKDIQNEIIPGLCHWVSPTHFAYFPCTISTAGFLGEMLSTGFNIVPFGWVASPAATELESRVLDWLGKMLQLPNCFLFSSGGLGGGGGVLQGTTCEAIFCTLVAARDQMLRKIGRENINKLVVYGSDQTHSTVQKAAKMAGIDPNNYRAIPTSKTINFGLSPHSLLSSILSDVKSGLIPLYLCATVGTTSTTAVDPIGPLCEVAKEYDIWVHVDAAYAGSACICPEFRHFIDGVENVDSFSLNAHKWFFSNMDCCCLWVKDSTALVKALSTNPEYLRNEATESKQVIDYKDWQISLSRKFRALKLWLILRSYGVSNLRNFIRSHIKMAKLLEGLIASDKRFEIVVPRTFSMVCFRLKLERNFHLKLHENGDHDDHNYEDETNELNRELLESINASGKVYMTHTKVGGIYIIRCPFGTTLTEERHVHSTWKLVQEHANGILSASDGNNIN